MPKARLIATTATAALRVLWSEGFFEKSRKITDITENLSARHHHFSDAELGMALFRAKKYLTRRGNRGSYEYIQKYPYAEEQGNVEAK